MTASALGGSNNFVAFATVEYTGDLNVKQAAVTVTCNESGIQTETTDKFVPVSRINNFTIVPSGGGTITIFGNAFTSVTGVRLGSGINFLLQIRTLVFPQLFLLESTMILYI